MLGVLRGPWEQDEEQQNANYEILHFGHLRATLVFIQQTGVGESPPRGWRAPGAAPPARWALRRPGSARSVAALAVGCADNSGPFGAGERRVTACPEATLRVALKGEGGMDTAKQNASANYPVCPGGGKRKASAKRRKLVLRKAPEGSPD